jgi:hypothetical protein
MVQYTYNKFGKISKYRKIGEDYFRVKEDGTLAKDKNVLGLHQLT